MFKLSYLNLFAGLDNRVDLISVGMKTVLFF